MNRYILRLMAPATALAALSACATPAYVSPVEVTRFTGSSPAELGRGTIRIDAATGLDSSALEYGLYKAELAQELTTLGYELVSGSARQIAVLGVDQSINRQQRRGPISVGGGAGTGSYGSGVGLGVGINLGGNQRADEIYTQVAIQIRPEAGGNNLWEGRADFTATENSDFADPALAADRAIGALFRGFPGRSGETITVE